MPDVWGFGDENTARRAAKFFGGPADVSTNRAPPRRRRVASNDETALIAVTRTGGIAGRATTTVPHTFPSATVDLIDPETGDFYSPNREEVAHNMTRITIFANSLIQLKRFGDLYFVDVDDCS